MSKRSERPSKKSYHERERRKYGWDGSAELDLMRHFCRESFWMHFLYSFGAGLNEKGKRWIDEAVHKPMADWFQGHIVPWMEARKAGHGYPLHLVILVHREIGKTTLITRAGQSWLHLRDPEIATATGAEKIQLSVAMLDAIKAVMDGSDASALWGRLYGSWAAAARKWSGREVTHAGRRNTSRQDPSMVAFGVETSLTGSHPDAYFYDDPISYERLATDTNWLETVKGQISSLIPVIQSDGLAVWVGTRYDMEDHYGDAFKALGIASISGMSPDGLEATPGGVIHLYFMAGRDRDGVPTTPKVWPEPRLQRYQKTNPLRYASQIMNDPAISELNPITPEQIAQCGVDRKDVPWASLRYVITTDTAFSDGERLSRKDETVMLVQGLHIDGSGDVYVIEGHGNAAMRAEHFARLLVATVQRYRRLGFRIIAITDEKIRAGKKGAWQLTLANYFADANEPMPRFLEFERGNTPKYQRLHAATTFWVDGHVRWVKGAPGMDRLVEQMGRIGQYAVNPRIKIDWADAHSDTFQPELYRPMRRPVAPSPLEHGSAILPVDGLHAGDFYDDDDRRWLDVVPREPIRS